MPGQRHSQPTPTPFGSRVYARLGVTCHLHSTWQNDRGLLRAAAVTRGMVRTPNKSQHTKFTPEENILLPLLPGFELATFRSRVRRSTNTLTQTRGKDEEIDDSAITDLKTSQSLSFPAKS